MAKTEPPKQDSVDSNATEETSHSQDARIVAGPKARTAVQEPSEVEAAWLKWSRGVQEEPRVTSQWKAAFEAGWDARG